MPLGTSRRARIWRPWWVVRRFSVAAAVGLLVAAAFGPSAAQAHAFLIDSSPQPGARLATSPPAVVLTFSESFIASSARVTMRQAGGGPVKLSAPSIRGSTLHQTLPAGLQGGLVVSWHVVADDGHPTDGQLAFAVGNAGKIPAVKQGSQSGGSANQIGISIVILLGLVLAAGASRILRRRVRGV